MSRLRARARLELIEQRTVVTHSDHDALLVLIRHTNRRGRHTYYVHVTWNAGNGTTDDLTKILGIAATLWTAQRRGTQLVLLSGQEWGDRDDLYRTLRAAGYTTTPGVKPGDKSTPFAWGPGWTKRRRSFSATLLLPTYIGPGTGPDRNKRKAAVGAIVHAPGCTITGWSAHWVPTQGNPPRFHAALEMTRALLAAAAHWRNASSGGADTNTDTGASLAPMVRAGWTDNQTELGRIVTHPPNGAIDRIFARASRPAA